MVSQVMAQDVQLKKINSVEMGYTRTLKLYIPASYEQDSTRLYPLTVIFDAENLFDVYVGNMKLFAQKDMAPEQIVVGLMQQEDGFRKTDIEVDKVTGLPTENSDRFYRFVRSELLDYMEENYRLSPFRTLVGATKSANFVNYFVIEEERGFDAFMCINPYYTPDMPVFLDNAMSGVRSKLYYYLNNGHYHSNERYKSIEQVAFTIKNIENPSVAVKYDIFDQSTTISSIGQGIAGAMAHIFSAYSYITREEFVSNIQHLSPSDAIDYLKKKYIDIDYLFGTNLKIRERDIYAVESIIIDEENGRYLAEFGEMIEKLYPETPLSDYYIGMFYERQGKYKQALKFYKNGYAKMDQNGENAEDFYQNIERVQGREDEAIEMKELEKAERKANKDAFKEQRKAEKEMRDNFRDKNED
jgi:predicted alpha/beta superfamily hydrolase